MNWAAVGLSVLVAIVFVELIVRTGFLRTAAGLLVISNKASHVLRSKRISDHWKEKVILRYSRDMMSTSLRLALVLAVAGGVIWAIGFCSERYAQINLFDFLVTWQGLVFTTVAAMIYVALFHRRRSSQTNESAHSATSEYSTTDRLLHRIALGSTAVREMTFDLEQAAGGKATTDETTQLPQVFVAGLARAGTTILMRELYASGRFRSLTYRDMPFVLMPNLWRRVASIGARDKVATERAHGDGINVNYDSPEALEEVFWETFTPKQYLHGDRLIPHSPNDEIIGQFRTYVDAIIRSGEKSDPPLRYLSKNNNNILRLPTLREAFPNSLIIIPFRDPLQQALSLRRQHRRFVADNAEDAFAGQYMAWLAHHEFGADHRPFCFDEEAFGLLAQYDPEQIEYWLALWAHVYDNLLRSAPENAIFLSYERLCDPDSGSWAVLLESTGLADCSAVREPHFRLSESKCDEPIPEELRRTTADVHAKLLARSI